MHSKLKRLLEIGILLMVSAGCTSPQSHPPLPSAPTVQETPLPSSVTPAAAPPLASLQMIDANNGWAWTNSDRLLRTADGGQTWIDRTPAGKIWSASFYPLDAQTAWLTIFLEDSSRNGLLYTSDGGQTWALYPYAPASNLHFADALNGWAEDESVGAGSAFFALSQTNDGGKTWTPIPLLPPQPEMGLSPNTLRLCSMCNDSFYYDPNRVIIVYGDMATMQPAGSVRMQTSFDLGKTWQTQNLPLPQENADALVMPYPPTFFTDKNGLLPVSLMKMNSDGSNAYQRLAFYATQNGGTSWSLLPGVLDDVSKYPPRQILSSRDVIVVCGNALWTTHDGAQTWQKVNSNLDFTQTDKRWVTMLDFIDTNAGWTLITENETNTLFRTADGGRTWAQITPLLAGSSPVKVTSDSNIPTPTLSPAAP